MALFAPDDIRGTRRFESTREGYDQFDSYTKQRLKAGYSVNDSDGSIRAAASRHGKTVGQYLDWLTKY